MISDSFSPDETTAGFGSLDGVKVIEKTGNAVTMEFSVPSASPYFDGHFPGFSILPALATIELVLRFAAEHLETGIDVQEIRRIKFLNRIMPDKLYLLRMEKNALNLSFKVLSSGGETVYSSGTLVMPEGGTRT
jgi:3-hydroxymyristoyl/3-hydroxydecanoyl-(acyl carrier protein) dehydratase